MDLHKLLYNINDRNYKHLKLYTETIDAVDSTGHQGAPKEVLRFILITSSTPFVLSIPNTINIIIANKYKDMIEANFNVTNDSKAFKKQLLFLKHFDLSEWNKIKGIGGPGYLPGLCCLTDDNICLKSLILDKQVFLNYSTTHGKGPASKARLAMGIGSLYPIFNILYFLECKPDVFNSVLTTIVADIVRQEEEFNEKSSQNIVDSLEELRKKVKEKLYEINKLSFNTRRDIIKNTEALDKLAKMKLESVDKKDSIRFNIERLIAETESIIEELYINLATQRNEINKITSKYSDRIFKLKL
jgi:hypothetical protein